MERQLTLRVIVERPPGDVDFGIQEGPRQRLQDRPEAEIYEKGFAIRIPDSRPRREKRTTEFSRLICTSLANNRFIYLDIGTYAGQTNTPWGRRLKIPLAGITWAMIEQASDTSLAIEVRVPGTGRDGGPTCGTVKQFSGWMLSK